MRICNKAAMEQYWPFKGISHTCFHLLEGETLTPVRYMSACFANSIPSFLAVLHQCKIDERPV